jgi:regulator of protease activity HflC (stomatin/prohibitin superfamily)
MANQATFYKPIPIFMKTFEEARKNEPLLRIGGPGRINIPPGFAVVTEVNGRFRRVLGPGTRTLYRFEYPRTVVDIRPQERELDNVSMVTSDGIELTTSISVTFQVDKGKEKPTPDQPFPFDPDAVRQVAYADTNQGEGSISSWESLPLIVTSGQLKDIIAEYRLDELILSEQNGIDIHRRLQLEMERRSRAMMRRFGVEIRGTRLGSLELPEPVTDQRIRYWQSYWNKQRFLQLADGEAEILEMQEIARSEAEAIMLQAIVEGLQRAKRAGRDVSSREVVALRLIESLEGMARQSEQLMPLPTQLMPQLNSIRRELMLTSGTPEENTSQE